MSPIAPVPEVTYGIHRHISGVDVPTAITRIQAALMAEGFGVLTEIDVQSTMQQKLGVETRPYVILGACAPPFALEALSKEPAIGLLMPCNVVVASDGAGGCTLSAIDAKLMISVAQNPALDDLAHDVHGRLSRAIAAA